MFLLVTLVLAYSKNVFALNRALLLEALTDRTCVIVSIDWRTPTTILPVFYKQMLLEKFYRREGVTKIKCYAYHSNHVFYVMATIISLLFLLFHLYRVEVMSRCRNNLSFVFIHTWFHCQASKTKRMVQ